jgi:hypothetical protein
MGLHGVRLLDLRMGLLVCRLLWLSGSLATTRGGSRRGSGRSLRLALCGAGLRHGRRPVMLRMLLMLGLMWVRGVLCMSSVCIVLRPAMLGMLRVLRMLRMLGMLRVLRVLPMLCMRCMRRLGWCLLMLRVCLVVLRSRVLRLLSVAGKLSSTRHIGLVRMRSTRKGQVSRPVPLCRLVGPYRWE